MSPRLVDEKAAMAAVADTERTPLIQAVPVRPYTRDRYPHHTLRRICTVVLTVVPIVVITTFLLVLFIPNVLFGGNHGHDGLSSLWTGHAMNQAWPQNDHIRLRDLKEIINETIKAEKAREWSKYYTAGPHLAGKNLTQALWTQQRWKEFGLAQTEIVSYDVLLNYPVDHRLALLRRKDNETEVVYEASLEEDVLDEDGTSGLEDRIPTFHGYSANGNVTAPYVFVNYGTYQDFEDLLAANVSLVGKIALAKYGGIFRGLKVKRAQELGMVGAILYSDPGDDGEVTEENGYEAYPKGGARNPSAVQRGSTQFLSIAPGDPTTPGYPSKPGAPRQPVDHSIPSIPSLPISYSDALPLLKALNGHGPKASDFNKYWQGGGLKYKGVDYNIGPSPDEQVINLVNEVDYQITPLWNVIGIINGTIPDEVVVLGNHRDAWIAGGAGDPNSGSAAFNEVIRALGIALEAGWKPLRTIVFASWDGEEYGLVGSTEWVEEYVPWLSKAAVAYLNVDVAVSGPVLKVASAPLLEKIIKDVAAEVQSPNQTVPGSTVADIWDHHIATMGSGSDFTAFQDFVGIPSLDVGFTGGKDSPIYHYHSNYDSFDWMDRFGDSGFAYHEAAAKLWALLAVELVESPVLKLNATDYAVALGQYLESVEKKARESGDVGLLSLLDEETADADVDAQGKKHKHKPKKGIFHPLEKAIRHLHHAAVELDQTAATLAAEVAQLPDLPWWKLWKKLRLFVAVRRTNTKLKLLERQFVHAPGLDGRPWFKHTVFAPGRWTGYAGATFPGLVEAIEDRDVVRVRKWVGVLTEQVWRAARLVRG